MVTIHFDNIEDFRYPDMYTEPIECAAFVNCRRVPRGRPAVLALSFHGSSRVCYIMLLFHLPEQVRWPASVLSIRAPQS